MIKTINSENHQKNSRPPEFRQKVADCNQNNRRKRQGLIEIDKDGGELYQRDDDNETTVQNRLKVYWDQTSPLIGYYKNTGVLVDIDGNQDIDAVTEALKAAVINL